MDDQHTDYWARVLLLFVFIALAWIVCRHPELLR